MVCSGSLLRSRVFAFAAAGSNIDNPSKFLKFHSSHASAMRPLALLQRTRGTLQCRITSLEHRLRLSPYISVGQRYAQVMPTLRQFEQREANRSKWATLPHPPRPVWQVKWPRVGICVRAGTRCLSICTLCANLHSGLSQVNLAVRNASPATAEQVTQTGPESMRFCVGRNGIPRSAPLG